MPNQLSIDQLQPGMRLATALTDGEEALLPAGKVLSAEDIEKLRSRGPDLQAAVEAELSTDAAGSQPGAERDKPPASRNTLVDAIRQARGCLREYPGLSPDERRSIEAAIIEILQFLRDHPRLTTDHAAASVGLCNHTAQRLATTLLLGNATRNFIAKMAQRSQARAAETHSPTSMALAPLGIAALLADLSLWNAYDDLDQADPLNAQQRQTILDHPHASADLMPESLPQLVRLAVRHHHENHVGTGYPGGLKGVEVPLYARLLRVADAFSAATAASVNRPAKPAAVALWEMTAGPSADLYDPAMIKVFQTVIHPFPVGAKLRLACGRYAVVVRPGKRHGLLPEVLVAYDENNQPLKGTKIKGPVALEDHPELRIVAFGDLDLTTIYGEDPVFVDPPKPPAEYETLFEALYP